MSRRPALIPQSDATRLFKAAKAAGYERARLIAHKDGTFEIVGEPAEPVPATSELSPFEQWQSNNAR